MTGRPIDITMLFDLHHKQFGLKSIQCEPYLVQTILLLSWENNIENTVDIIV